MQRQTNSALEGYMHVYTYADARAYTYIYIHIHVSTYLCVYIYIYGVHIHVYNVRVYIYIGTYVRRDTSSDYHLVSSRLMTMNKTSYLEGRGDLVSR